MNPLRLRSRLAALFRRRPKTVADPVEPDASSRTDRANPPRRRVIWLGAQITPIPIIFEDPPHERPRDD